MNTFTISGLYKEAWVNFKNNVWFLVTSTFVYYVVYGVLSREGRGPGSFILHLGAMVVSLMFSIGMYKIGLKVFEGNTPDYSDFKTTPQIFFRVLWASILTAIFIVLGLLLFIIPGIILMIRLSLTAYVVLDKQMTAYESIKESWRLTKGYTLKIIGVIILALIVFVVSLLPFGLGIVLSMPYLYLVGAFMYKKIASGTAIVSEEKPIEPERVVISN